MDEFSCHQIKVLWGLFKKVYNNYVTTVTEKQQQKAMNLKVRKEGYIVTLECLLVCIWGGGAEWCNYIITWKIKGKNVDSR